MHNRIDLHLHTTASDGSDTPSELIDKAKGAGLEVIAITDHDTLVGSKEAVSLPHDGIKIITGIEFSCHSYGECDFDCHILGYGFDTENSELLGAIKHGRDMRLQKLEARLVYLKSKHEIEFTSDEIEWLHSLNSVAKPHLARLIMKRGLADSVADAIDLYLKGDGFPDDRIDAKMAIDAILAAGGVPVYAHPLGGEREARPSDTELKERVKTLSSLGLMGLECYYSRYNTEDCMMLTDLAHEYGLSVSGGSDYHGKNKTVVIGTLSSDGRVWDAADFTVMSKIGDQNTR